jgi:hypothetical protein
MGFNEVVLADIELEKGPAPIPAGKYIFTLLPGTSVRVNEKTGEESLNVPLAIAEGDYSGRREWASYPDPNSITQTGKNAGKPKTWSKQAMKKLQVSLGHDPLPGETPVDYFNRIAAGGNARFSGDMSPANFIKDGATEPEVRFNIFSPAPAV